VSDYQRPINPQRREPNSTLGEWNAVVASMNQEAGAKRSATPEVGIKHDQQKEPLSLLSRTWLLGVAKVMAFGAKKYAAHNWRNGIERSRLISAALRHIMAYNEGQDLDEETKLSHLDHASCCLMFARELHDTRPDLDDRWKGK
jgi:hypothetical protein